MAADKGDSVFGTWQVLDPAQPAGAPSTRVLTGVLANGTLRLETEASDRRIRMNDDDRIERSEGAEEQRSREAEVR